jgi:outer membrane protein insertion porin family
MRRCVVIFAFALAVFLGLSGGTPCFAQDEGEWYLGKPIRDVVFSGLKHTRPQELEGLLGNYVGKDYSYELVEELQIRLYALGFFDFLIPSTVPADAERSAVILRFAVTERPVVSRISFSGNAHIRPSELLDVITIKVGDRADSRRVGAEERSIINKYLEKGYPAVSVRSDVQTNTAGDAAVTFFITEGERIAIQEFRFNGNTAFPDRTLKGLLSLKTKGLLNDGSFQEAKLIADRMSIAQYYQDRGFIDAEVRDVTRTEVKDEKGNIFLILTFEIFEGSRYTFGGINFEGNLIFSTAQLEKLVYSKIGETVRVSRLEADMQRVGDLYYESGYIFNTITREEIRDTLRNVVSYRIVVIERGRAHIESIRVAGNEKTKTDVILREIPLEPGDVFSKTKIGEAMRNLYNLQFFSTIVPETEQGSSESLMDLVFQVEEQPTMDVQFGLTFSGSADPEQFPVSLMLRLNDRNFRGTGNSLGAEATLSPDTQSGSITYDHRYIFGLPLSLGVDFTLSHTQRLAAMNHGNLQFNGDEDFAYPDPFNNYAEYEAASMQPPDAFMMRYQQWYISLGLSTGYRWSTPLGNLSVGGGLRIGFLQNTYDADLYRPFDPTIRRNNNRFTPANSLWTTVTLDQRDLAYDPSSGYYASQRFGLNGIFPMELEKYIRSDTKAEYYHTLLNIPVGEKWSFKVIGAVHTGLSFIMSQPGQSVPYVEAANRLAVDGMFVGRGWKDDYRIKGLALWENWAEIRIPLVPNLLAWDFFFDAAGVSPTPKAFFTQFDGDSMRFSLGFGLRFTIPQFPLRFSFAKRFRTIDGKVNWEKGSIFSSAPGGGLDPVISFAVTF